MKNKTAHVIDLFRPASVDPRYDVGADRALAEALGVSRQAVNRWRRLGRIPYQHHDEIVRLAKARRKVVVVGDLKWR